MAGRRGSVQQQKSTGNSLTIYGPMALVLIVLATTMYTFGIDFGFVSFGGNPNINVLYGAGAVCIVLSYVTDIMYIKAIRKFYKQKPTWLVYVPYFNTLSVYSKTQKYVGYVLIAIISIVALPAYTPLGRFMPVDYLIFMATNSILIIIGAMAVYSIMRGYRCFKLKTSIEKFYKNKINDSFGSGGTMSMVSYAIYFLPIIRSISLFTDINFINTVRLEAEEMQRREGRV